jgi:L-arabinose isomerase
MHDRARRLLAAHGIPSRPTGAAAGPRLDVLALSIPAADMPKALRLQTAMAAALDSEGVALRQHGRLLLVEVPRRRGQTVDLETIGPALGVTATGRRVGISLDRTRPHAIVGG